MTDCLVPEYISAHHMVSRIPELNTLKILLLIKKERPIPIDPKIRENSQIEQICQTMS